MDTPSSAPNHGKIRFLKPLPHAGDECGCVRCDELRQENGMARVSVNWPRDYPPAFYGRVEVEYYGEEELVDWEDAFKDWEQ